MYNLPEIMQNDWNKQKIIKIKHCLNFKFNILKFRVVENISKYEINKWKFVLLNHN